MRAAPIDAEAPTPAPRRSSIVRSIRCVDHGHGRDFGAGGAGRSAESRRRDLLLLAGTVLASSATGSAGRAEASDVAADAPRQPSTSYGQEGEVGGQSGAGLTQFNFSRPGPLTPVRLPKLEHTCAGCFPQCVADRCLIRLDVLYPKGPLVEGRPYPLAIITGGFLVPSEEYLSYAERLASWGYVAVLYDKIESPVDALDDIVSAEFIKEIIDWAGVDPLVSQVADNRRVYLVGHSRGGKVSVLAAQDDSRVVALCLIDPVDNTVYAPLAPGFPSAIAALNSVQETVPMAVIGADLAHDCAPEESNYKRFFDAAQSPAWEVVLKDTGHFQFLDRSTAVEKLVCVT
ncbi:unnamed protein product, partial [Ostreobium quekettii]